MPLPFEKTLLFIGVKYKLDAIKVLDELFKYFPIYVFDDPPLEYIANSLGEMIVSKSIIAGRYDTKTYLSFLKKAKLLDLNENWDYPIFQDLLFDSEMRLKIDIMEICGFRQQEIFQIAKEKYPELDEIQILTYMDCFCNFSGMQFIAKKNFVESYIEDQSIKRKYNLCLENRSQTFVRSKLNITPKALDPMTLAIRSAQISMERTDLHSDNNNDVELRSYLNINMRAAALLQSLGAGSKSAIEELEQVLDGPSPAPVIKTYTLVELENLKKESPSPEGNDDDLPSSSTDSSQLPEPEVPLS